LAAAVSAEQIMQALSGAALGIGMLDEHVQVTGPIEAVLIIGALIAMVWGVHALAVAETAITDLPPRDLPPAVA